jgi:4'-phosphopantetheinyl transferase
VNTLDETSRHTGRARHKLHDLAECFPPVSPYRRLESKRRGTADRPNPKLSAPAISLPECPNFRETSLGKQASARQNSEGRQGVERSSTAGGTQAKPTVPLLALDSTGTGSVTDSMHISDAAFQLRARLTLPENEVHLWRVDLSAVAAEEPKWQQILSAEERARASRFHFSRDRQYFTATRALLRVILAGYIASEPAELVFRYAEKGKPSLSPHHSGNQVEFNVSHSGTRALLAFARGRALGIDVEQIRENFEPEALAVRFFSAHEQSHLAALEPSQKYQGFFRCWTRKEAYIKAEGSGLSLPLPQFDVSLKPGDENALLATRPHDAEAGLWSLREIPAGDGYVAALCVQGHGWRLKS